MATLWGMTSHRESQRWPQWLVRQPWLSALVPVAEEEARERGDTVVGAHHLALAVTRDERAAALLDDLGLQARRWRDYLNFILGVNAGKRAEREQRVRDGQRRTPAQLYHHGALAIDGSALSLLEVSRGEADRAGADVRAEHLLVALTASGAGIGTGTAWWLGLGPTMVRRAAGLPIPPPASASVPVADWPRPHGHGPLVLFGGGALPQRSVDVLFDLARRVAADGRVRLAVVGAAADDPATTGRRCEELQVALPGAAVVDAGLGGRDAAHDPRVVDALSGADAVFLDGGGAHRLAQALAGTPALQTLAALSDRGAVIAGYSAGTMALGVGARHGPWAEPTTVNLLGWLPDLVVVPHCSGPGMLDGLRHTMTRFPGVQGLGVAHEGAVLLRAGWRHIESLDRGFDDGSIVLPYPDAPPHLLHAQPYRLP